MPDVTGPPVVAFYSIQSMQQGYVRGGVYALITIVGLTLVHFRRLKPTWLALLLWGWRPLDDPLYGALWMQMNIANLIVIPLFMGMAFDNGIHLVDRALEPPRQPASVPRRVQVRPLSWRR